MPKDREYPSDLTDKQWRLFASLVPKVRKRGCKATDRRWVVEAILYVTVTGWLARCRNTTRDYEKADTTVAPNRRKLPNSDYSASACKRFSRRDPREERR